MSAPGGTPTSGLESPAARVDRALERLHDARLAGDGPATVRARQELDRARTAQRANQDRLAGELGLAQRARAFAAGANGSIFDRALRGERLWPEVLAEAQEAVATGRDRDLGIEDPEALDDIHRQPSRIRSALYAGVVRASYSEVRQLGRADLALAARAQSAAAARRLVDFLVENDHIGRPSEPE